MRGWKNVALYLFSCSFVGLILLCLVSIYAIWCLPPVDQLREVSLQVPLKIYTEDGVLIGEFGERKRTPVTLDQIPPKLIWAVLDTEDRRFYEHQGVDFYSLLRAVRLFLTSGKKSQGASTITMQVARNFFLNREKTFIRKFNEILLAIKIDHNLTKEEILELYLNKIYFGNRAYGVAAAAQVYYQKNLEELTTAEMAMIAGLPQAPSRDNPLVNPNAAMKRREHVLLRMLESNHLSEAEYLAALREEIVPVKKELDRLKAPYVAEMVRNALLEKFGETIYEAGIVVWTTINSKLQQRANQTVWEGVLDYEMRHDYRGPEGKLEDVQQLSMHQNLIVNQLELAVVEGYQDDTLLVYRNNQELVKIKPSGYLWAKYEWEKGDLIRIVFYKNEWFVIQIPKLETALLALEPNSGAIKALCGGWFLEPGGLNRITQSERQAGSIFKPFVYSAALNKGYTLASVVNDSPLVVTTEGKTWRPQNDSGLFYGPTTLRKAIVTSRNLVTIRVLQNIGIRYAKQYLQKFGFNKATELPNNLSLALGSGSYTPLKIAEGYAVFANGGYRTVAYLIDRIDRYDLKGQKTLFKAKPYEAKLTGRGQPAQRVIDEANAYLMNDVLRGVIDQGTGRRAKILKREDLAGKTGSTNDLLDAWFVGYNPDLLAVVWSGFDQPQSTHEYGARLALPIWVKFMEEALRYYPVNHWVRPETVVTATVNAQTGLTENITTENANVEIFITGTVPEETTRFDYEELKIDNRQLF